MQIIRREAPDGSLPGYLDYLDSAGARRQAMMKEGRQHGTAPHPALRTVGGLVGLG